MSLQELFGKLYATVLQHLHVELETPIERHRDPPGAREDVGILDRDLVLNGIGGDRREPLLKPQRFAVKITGAIEPVGGELLLSPQSVEIIKFGDPGSGR